MSTPTTATATLPHYRRHHYPYQAGATSTTYRTNGLPPPHPTTTNQLLLSPTSSSTRLPPSFQTPSVQYSPSTVNGDSRTLPAPNVNRLTPSSTASSRPSYALGNLPPDANYPATMASSNASTRSLRPRRQRSREPDWSSFYKNGLPKEIIVIDDTPEPEAGKSTADQPTHHIVSGGANAYTNGAPPASSRPAAKKRKRDSDVANLDNGYYSQTFGSQTTTPLVNGSVAGSSSTDHATAQTGAATSLSSGSQYDYDGQLGNKRKRTRQQVANEAKRREVDLLGDAYISYKPPPHPPKKASPVPVRIAHDVSLTRRPTYGGVQSWANSSQREYDKNVKVDDDDGHYIVVPDSNLTDRCMPPNPTCLRLRSMLTFRKTKW